MLRRKEQGQVDTQGTKEAHRAVSSPLGRGPVHPKMLRTKVHGKVDTNGNGVNHRIMEGLKKRFFIHILWIRGGVGSADVDKFFFF